MQKKYIDSLGNWDSANNQIQDMKNTSDGIDQSGKKVAPIPKWFRYLKYIALVGLVMYLYGVFDTVGLQMTPEEFGTRYNNATAKFKEYPLQIQSINYTKATNKEFDEVQFVIDKDHVKIIGKVNKNDKSLRDICVIMIPGGPVNTVADVAIIVGSVIKVVDPGLVSSEVSNVLKSLGITNANYREWRPNMITLRGVRYDFTPITNCYFFEVKSAKDKSN